MFDLCTADWSHARQEYTGIDAGRLELMEERLAEDVRREAVKHGRVLVAREVLSSAEQSSATIQDSHEVLSSTPLSSTAPVAAGSCPCKAGQRGRAEC